MRVRTSIIMGVMIAFIISGSAAYAGGSFLMDDIKPVFAQSPDIQEYLFSTLELEKSGQANRIGNNVNPRLGGMRLGPYCIYAKPKGTAGKNTMEVCINTEYHFSDKTGRSCTLEQAHSVTESFVSVEIRPIKE
jgi:hypothetical protein